jgi:hypothetical protein
MAKIFDIKKFNRILQDHNQTLYALSITGHQIVLSNGLVLSDKISISRCKKRIMNGHEIWKKKFDEIYGLDAMISQTAEKLARSQTSKFGGIVCQERHHDAIKKNLNTGTPWNKGLEGKYPYSHKHTAETKAKISNANSGKNNGMYGKQMPTDKKNHLSILMKEKIRTGSFTPNSNNRSTHWDSCYQGKKYRSSWECLYQYFDNDAEYETLRIPYFFENKEFIYIVDFVNHTTKTIVEVKPKEMLSNKKTAAKIAAAKEWATNNGYNFVFADKQYLISKGTPEILSNFDSTTQSKISKLYETDKQKNN